ncbi:monocarboxylate transporter 4-like [Asbolus verrucosus]|uniref:Monocarboxylate transporter 4-like n=1 Tax=Asbolus verrucosus TaxID=1661398 RepID=A0A482VI45_ASBVE|nr:monocarboxylate transporter 4-like [Asbolus verrucosus]
MKSIMVPPDGGYGWVIVFANALSSFIIIALMQNLGLVFKDTFAELGYSAMQGSFIINVNASFGKLTGPITGVLLKVYDCRKIGMLAAFLLTVGMVLTSFCETFPLFFAAYGILTSLGMQMSESTQRLALNLYFKKKRSIAMGYAVTIAGFGPILLPQLIRFLMKIYTTQEVILISAGVCAHVFISAIILQPVKWHMKLEETKEPTQHTKEEQTELLVEEDKKNGAEKVTESDKNSESIFRNILNNITKTFDLDLLKDPVFDNILIGLALATFAELNFSLLIPFILHDFGLDTDQIAAFLSTLGVADIIFRFFGPYIGNYFTKPSRLMYAYALTILIVIRFSLLISKNFYVLLGIAFALGIAKGVRKVYMWLVIPDYVPMEKLPSAGGMEALANGLSILVGGPILGALRDATGSYVICIIVMNCVTITTIVMWLLEAIIVKYKKQNLSKNKSR